MVIAMEGASHAEKEPISDPPVGTGTGRTESTRGEVYATVLLRAPRQDDPVGQRGMGQR